MQLLLLILTLPVLVAIFYYDLKHFAVPAYLILMLLALAVARLSFGSEPLSNLRLASLNIIGTLAVLLSAIIILFIRKQQVVNPVNKWIGLADLLLFLVLCISFSPVNYLAFFILSSFLILAVKLFAMRGDKPIPLAGMQSIILAVVFLLAQVYKLNLYNDHFILNLLSGNAG
jgi:hypothetical protein